MALGTVADKHIHRHSGDPLCVLIVDDQQDIALLLKEITEDLGNKAHAAFAGHEAVELCRLTLPDVVFLDLWLPDADGLDIADALRKACHPKVLKIVAMTGHSEESVKRQTAEAGFDMHLIKPIPFSIFEEILNLLRYI